jgi:hypothetical protein
VQGLKFLLEGEEMTTLSVRHEKKTSKPNVGAEIRIGNSLLSVQRRVTSHMGELSPFAHHLHGQQRK